MPPLYWDNADTHFPNIRIVVNLVSPKHRQDCLDIGTSGALVPGKIKALLRLGLCISVNCVREILQTNARSFLKTTCWLKVHPNGTPNNQLSNAAGLRVTAIEPISKNNDFSMACPRQDGSLLALLSFRDLNNISASDINKVLTTSGVNSHCDISSAIFALRRRLVEYIRLCYRALEALNSLGQGQLYVGKRFVGIAVKFKKKDE
ncbi:hypothetical protein K504DRAFT_467057 [Pleomassaria siparia CBS 279.74]|uniref:Uncharacterized protein n=1 Tax=Pleomassaria siparia CBS 279.74 TaxID=1314801 RepID=A0A6G1JPQ4_9PLEO|nr:hypothetical protein K504DRAFT_467057 [Pleomassaria siparia CBS 279.74]